MLITLPNLLTPDELRQAQALLAAAPWVSGTATAGAQAAQAKNNQQVPEEAPQLPALRQLVLGALGRSAAFFTAALPLHILPPLFNRYAGAHIAAARCRPHRPIGMKAVVVVRADVSATLFLSEPQDYAGGELKIEDTFGTHDIKLPAGSLVLYPSSSIHAVAPVTAGQRQACFLFLQSMVRDAGQRRLLYEMDMALLQLRQTLGETAPVVRLTGTYHNLLRQWAQT